MPSKKFHLSVEEKWAVHHNDAQVCRSNVLSFQSILLAVGAMLINGIMGIYLTLVIFMFFQSGFIFAFMQTDLKVSL